jgi:hypothetical protein
VALLVGVATASVVILLSLAYTAERKWVAGQAPGEGVTFEADFSAALHGCVATNDSERLADLDQGHRYRISGWFLNDEKTTPVIQCMRKKGWLAVPTTLYTP